MTWDEILILLIMVMGLFAIDMLVAKFNLKAGRIVAVLTFFVMMPLGLVAGIAALVCMNVSVKKIRNKKTSEDISLTIETKPKAKKTSIIQNKNKSKKNLKKLEKDRRNKQKNTTASTNSKSVKQLSKNNAGETAKSSQNEYDDIPLGYANPYDDPNYDLSGEGLDPNKYIYEQRRASSGEIYTVVFSRLDYPKGTHTDNHTSSTQKTPKTAPTAKKSENISSSIKIEPKKGTLLYQRYQQYIKNHPYMSYTEFLKEEESNERAYFQGKTWY